MRLRIDAQCPECGHFVDSSTGVGETEASATPEPGDFALCIKCAEPGVYRLNPDMETLGLRSMTQDEKVQLLDREDVREVQTAIRATSGMWLS